MKRLLYNVAAGVSLVVCVAMCVLWMRNLWASERLTWFFYDGRQGLTKFASASSWWGSLALEFSSLDTAVPAHQRPVRRHLQYSRMPEPTPPFDPGSVRIAAGFGRGTYRFSFQANERVLPAWSGSSTVVLIPWYALILLAAVPPLVWFRSRHRDRYRRRNHLCTRCGYDIRATPARCPECGAVAASPGTAA